MQSQQVVTAYLKSKQLLPFGLHDRYNDSNVAGIMSANDGGN